MSPRQLGANFEPQRSAVGAFLWPHREPQFRRFSIPRSIRPDQLSGLIWAEHPAVIRRRHEGRRGSVELMPLAELGADVESIDSRALELLARCTDGCSEAVLLAHGFRPMLIPELVRTGLATTQTEHVYEGGRVIPHTDH
jgi:hypothetical protein